MATSSDILILIPAAGASLRMRGADKLLEPVGGEAQLRRAVRAAVATGATVVVTLPGGGPHAGPRRREIMGLGATIATLPDAHEGMAASLRHAAGVAGMAAGLMIHLPDMPEITAEDLLLVTAAFLSDPDCVLRAATEDGLPGHPVILPRRLFGEVGILAGDAGARHILTAEDVNLVPLPGNRAIIDLDTPEDWADWRAARSGN
jgi:CTP:molybdopterin cytidylyltransferase MocA